MDPIQQLLLSQLAGDPAPADAPTLTDVLASSAADDPMTAAVLDALRRREERRAPGEREPDVSAAEPVEDAESSRAVTDVLQRLYDEVEVLRARNLQLADALGACPRCWGEDVGCPVCRGRGAPGGRRPDEALLTALVEPALRRRRAPLNVPVSMPLPEPTT